MILRPASLQDAQLLWEWANDPFVRFNSFNSDSIPAGNHIDWLKEKLASDKTIIYIVEMNKTPVAQIRYDCEEKQCANISFAVAAGYRGKGLGEQILLQSVMRACRELGVKRLQGAVLDHNEASKRTFVKAGFKKIGRQKISEKMCHIFSWECPEKIEGSGYEQPLENK
jgi:RimJ/RimL family protein N-acetyltransferase